MKKLVCICLCLLLQLQMLQAESYCVMSGNDGRVLEEKDMHKVQSVASISKIMTAVIALENSDIKETWTCSDAVTQAYGSMIYLQPGQQVSMRSLLYGLLLRSGNDAAIEIACHVAGNEEAFVKLMNEKAAALGMLNTEFRNASGLDEKDGGNQSTAYDMALLMRYAMSLRAFATISGCQYYTSEWNYRWKNKNRLLFSYPFLSGGKTGYTKKAGRTLVTTAEHEEMESVVVTLQGEDDFTFHQEKHTQVLQSMTSVTLMAAGTYRLQGRYIQLDEPLQVLVRKDGSERLQIQTHIADQQLYVEVQIGDDVQVYTYALQKQVAA